MVSLADSPGGLDPHRHLIELWVPAWSSRDTPSILTLVREDCVYEDVTLGAVSHGKEELRTFLGQAFAAMADFRLTVTLHLLEFTRAGMEWTMFGRQTGEFRGIPPANRTFSVRGASVIEFGVWPETGQPQLLAVSRQSDYWDLATLQQQLGHVPA